ncbi:MAG: glycosyltransferase [Candidatus Aenigmatarchaeota archaeon]
MKKPIIIVPCFRVGEKVKNVIKEVRSRTCEGEYPVIVAYNDCSPDNTLDVLFGLQKEYGCPEVILSGEKNLGLSGGMKNSFSYCLGEEPENVEVIEYPGKGFKGAGPDSYLIAMVGGDAQQKFWEIFEEAGVVVYAGKTSYGFMERWNIPGDKGDRHIKMPKERIEKEIIINRIARESLRRMGYDTSQIDSEIKNRGVGGGVRDLQTNKTFSGKKLERLYNELSGDKRYAFDLEVAIVACKEGEPIHWGIRNDYGEPATLGEGWKQKWGNSVKDKLYVIQKHSGMKKEDLRKLIWEVSEKTVDDGLASREIGELVKEYGRLYFSD